MMLFAEWTMEQSELRLSFLIVNCCSHIEQHYMQNTVGIEFERVRIIEVFLEEMYENFRLRVVPHFSSGIVERAKRERA